MGEALGILRAALSEPLVRSAPWPRPPKGQQDRERPCSGDASAGSLPARNGAPACSQPARENGGFGSHFQGGQGVVKISALRARRPKPASCLLFAVSGCAPQAPGRTPSPGSLSEEAKFWGP
ncbi:hypothetical protein ERJ75_001400700 [Trypanosoma vivax]|nr:hypothetical protein ERJ75_001400700 [Trypanosoma vivax]